MFLFRLLAFLCAGLAALAAAFGLSRQLGAENFLFIFSVVFIAVLLAAEIFFYFSVEKEVKELAAIIHQLKRSLKTSWKHKHSMMRNPIKGIRDEIVLYALQKQHEIDELRKTELIRKEFVADISHELKTPIFAAQGYVQTLMDGAMNDKDVSHKFLKRAAKSLDQLDLLVQDLLTLARVESGEIAMNKVVFDLAKVCEEVCEQLEDKAEKHKVHLKTSFDSKKVMAVGDSKRIEQVMINLISNAIHHSGEHGKVQIKLQEQDKYVSVKVIDNGEGIAEEHLKKIFERFYRIDKSRSRHTGGTGLGLAIAKQILEKHGAHISVESELGKGSAFSFRLPKQMKSYEVKI